MENAGSKEVSCFAVWKDRLISGHGSGKLRVWNVATGECEQVLEGHNRAVVALAVCGSRLASGCGDGSIQVSGDGCWWRAAVGETAARPYGRGMVACGMAGQAGERLG